uniref:PSII 6.1 kDa protein n=1 Tax=Phaeomonas parva TaxID=124430 RepID=A0A6U4JI56_9STRA|mmetsp:Transcript_43627/g.136900  ORF Transcript_43627/g.136900 Transcript_43627/m.136900 type:complete len:101 (+) Transcript_43627:518-820(+)
MPGAWCRDTTGSAPRASALAHTAHPQPRAHTTNAYPPPYPNAQAVMATEGTGEALGIDDGRLTFVLGAGFALIWFLFSGWAANQNTSEDFFDSIDRTGKL